MHFRSFWSNVTISHFFLQKLWFRTKLRYRDSETVYQWKDRESAVFFWSLSYLTLLSTALKNVCGKYLIHIFGFHFWISVAGTFFSLHSNSHPLCTAGSKDK